MKQLLHCFKATGSSSDDEDYWVTGLKDKAIVGTSVSAVVELAESDVDPGAGDDDNNQKDSSGYDAQPSNEIQAVAGFAVVEKEQLVLYAAVARANKLLSIHRIDDPQAAFGDDKTSIPATTIHKTPKRVSSLCFAQIPAKDTSTPPLTVLIAGDLVGDAVAYSLTESAIQTGSKESEEEAACPHRRLLVGHTASMLTSVELSSPSDDDLPQFLLSADRDEKVRVSHFPFTTRIHGFLLGHEAYVTNIALYTRYCLSCGGDGTLRVWDYRSCDELATVNLQSLDQAFGTTAIPTKVVAVGQSSEHDSDKCTFYVSVIYDGSNNMDTFLVDTQGGKLEIAKSQQFTLSSQPLAIVPWKDTQVLALLRNEKFLIVCETKKGTAEPQVVATLTDSASSLSPDDLPDSLLEKDKHGNIAMIKNNENRGPAQQMPWNDAKRKDTARTRNKRARQRRRKTPGGGSDEEDNEKGR
eukprot:CAMPEP_0172447418 /NCGR_PEP_ID=MMETSP1065-20121228/6740_1 /TAXON_ID=265537 /ORGANISM="Amphiprora paludosa, Strain CCMP125" /LENGTH=467 /DNA_ID=CAMNT_0013198719 /DNA_START=18 /DNA_END=1421 /DNA_ORIENTATION=-